MPHFIPISLGLYLFIASWLKLVFFIISSYSPILSHSDFVHLLFCCLISSWIRGWSILIVCIQSTVWADEQTNGFLVPLRWAEHPAAALVSWLNFFFCKSCLVVTTPPDLTLFSQPEEEDPLRLLEFLLQHSSVMNCPVTQTCEASNDAGPGLVGCWWLESSRRGLR